MRQLKPIASPRVASGSGLERNPVTIRAVSDMCPDKV